ncbi:MAG: hypothetical protein II816_01345, partial [Elusimicrobia bacterium]|nr:hypothetical protein [Elusimicrobiota bacterium]
MKKFLSLFIIFSILISSSGTIVAEDVSVSSDTAKTESFSEEDSLDESTLNNIINSSDMDSLKDELDQNVTDLDLEADKIQIVQNTDDADEEVENENEEDYEVEDYDNIFEDMNLYGSSNLKGKILKYSDVVADSNIEVSSKTVIPDDNDLGTYYMSGAIIEKTQNPEYDLNIPTTTALGMAGDRVLDKLNIEKTTDTVSQKDITKPATTKSSSPDVLDETSAISKKLKNLPFNSQLILSGRKTIGVNYSGVLYVE